MDIHIVFDFDCTISSRHLFHTIRSGEQYLKDVKKYCHNENGHVDIYTGRILNWIDKIESDFVHERPNKDTYAYKPSECGFASAQTFLYYLFGGKERIYDLRNMLNSLKDNGSTLHISTKGIVSEVIECLKGIGLLDKFEYIDGYDNNYENKVVYKVEHGFEKNQNTYFGRCSDLEKY